MKTAFNFNPVHPARLTGSLTVAALLFAFAVSCGAQQTVTVTAPAPTPYMSVSAGPDWTVWQSTNYELLP
ncbi:MAG TPA: hypothetical protein VNV43_03275, partial [Candidatus Acidoferrales bacterium]|nr:hypothetical protein [Candidatus Acidoferrales bacterium]